MDSSCAEADCISRPPPFPFMKQILLAGFLGMLGAAAIAGVFQPYPDAKLDEQLTADTVQSIAQSRPRAKLLYGAPQIWTTTASFDEVVAYYSKQPGAKEYILRTEYTTELPHDELLPSEMIKGAPPGGVKIKKAIFILDGSADANNSKRWVEITHPMIGKIIFSKPLLMGDQRDLTGITYVDKQQ